ncbi:MAG: phospholipase D family protein [Deltaproteobacteria bacterium]
MRVSLITQPFIGGRDLHNFVGDVAGDEQLTHLDIVVAWAKRSGLNRLRADLEIMGDRTGATRLIVGISEGGATRQGLELARELFDTVHVFHDRSGRTFHPKLYLAWGTSSARLLVGSHNATAGGVYFNYEVGLECELVLPSDTAFLNKVHEYIALLYGDAALCRELTDEILTELLANERYRIADEDVHRRPATTAGPEELDTDVDVDTAPPPAGSTASIFGISTQPKKPDPGATSTGRGGGLIKKATHPAPGKPAAAPSSPVAVTRRWFKRLSRADAQHPASVNTHPTGALRLVQAKHPINQTVFFRHDFFAGLPWARTPKAAGFLELTVVPFEVVIDGVDHGSHNLRVDDAAYKEAGQGNFTSVLHWDGLRPILQATDYTHHFVILERLANGAFRLEITATDPGPDAFIG